MLSKLKCLIVDDEPLALSLLESYVLKTPFLELASKCSNAFEALEALDAGEIHVAFIDIQMPELTGLELSKSIKKSTKIIFTTAFNEYALEGFRLEALDYLMKPFGFDEFYRAALRAKEWFSLVGNTTVPTKEQFIFVKSEYRQLKIRLEEVMYFEGLKDYVKIWIRGEAKPVLSLLSLKSLEEQLPSSQFMRVHRSFIVALDKIEAIERNQIIILDQRITVAEQYKHGFQNFLSRNSF
ncbi:LytTR family DNA-binding domain-containing protein [Flavobacterium sp. DGU11]|uniref:LytTR family DNA-binding domain-containing protein n=1 Tax=Flavobacterium arundinis TaxID=3139143 RepID=A0ABU9HSC0_9FLAO